MFSLKIPRRFLLGLSTSSYLSFSISFSISISIYISLVVAHYGLIYEIMMPKLILKLRISQSHRINRKSVTVIIMFSILQLRQNPPCLSKLLLILPQVRPLAQFLLITLIVAKVTHSSPIRAWTRALRVTSGISRRR